MHCLEVHFKKEVRKLKNSIQENAGNRGAWPWYCTKEGHRRHVCAANRRCRYAPPTAVAAAASKASSALLQYRCTLARSFCRPSGPHTPLLTSTPVGLAMATASAGSKAIED